MPISLTPETVKLLEARLRRGDFASPDDLVRTALETLDELEADPIEQLDPDTLAALDRAEAQSARGEGRPWEDVRAELRQRIPKS